MEKFLGSLDWLNMTCSFFVTLLRNFDMNERMNENLWKLQGFLFRLLYFTSLFRLFGESESKGGQRVSCTGTLCFLLPGSTLCLPWFRCRVYRLLWNWGC